MKYFSTILTILGLYFFVYACAEKPCTDDGCDDFNELTIPEPLEDIRGEIQIEKLVIPVIQTESKDEFVYSLNECIDYLYANEILPEHRVPKELIVAQAAIETGWGKSRFANEGNAMFGVRTWDLEHVAHMKAKGNPDANWGVKKYATKCQSVQDMIRILNTHPAYKEFRISREKQIDAGKWDYRELLSGMTAWSTNPDYKEIILQTIIDNKLP